MNFEWLDHCIQYAIMLCIFSNELITLKIDRFNQYCAHNEYTCTIIAKFKYFAIPVLYFSMPALIFWFLKMCKCRKWRWFTLRPMFWLHILKYKCTDISQKIQHSSAVKSFSQMLHPGFKFWDHSLYMVSKVDNLKLENWKIYCLRVWL